MMLAHDISKGHRTKDVKITQNITFETMLLAPDTLKGLKESGFHKPSPIQLYGIPIGKCGFDLLLEAKSGTGKTAVFSIIALEKLDFCKGLQVVILTPTREIAAQICDVLKQIGCMYKDLKIEVVMGGLPIEDDIAKFKKPVHIVVGSPGRLKHLIRDKYIDVKSVRLLVLDEADKLMESSFQSDIKYIHTSLPKQKQVIMSSATYPRSSRNLINSYVQNASHVCPDTDCILLGIEQKVTLVKYNSNIIKSTQDKFKELNKILGRLQFKQCLVFCNYQVRVAEVHDMLCKAEWPSEKLYGQQEQIDRLDALKTLQQYKCRILVSTDLAARGIDASNIDLVINFEPPYDWQTYLHRIGRAGRFGSYGLAITILSEGKEQQKFREMFKSTQLPINLRHLWKDEEFHMSNSVAPIHTSTSDQCDLPSDSNQSADSTEKVSCKEIWELLSGKDKSENFIETFESLCKFDESPDTSKIADFSELMLSLEDKNCQELEEPVEFKHIEMRQSNRSMIPQNLVTEREINMKNSKEISNENIINDSNENENKLKASCDALSVNVDNATITNKIDSQKDGSKDIRNSSLPTSFSSSKYKNRDTKRRIKKKIPQNKTFNSNVNNNIDSRIHFLPLQSHAEIPMTNGDRNCGETHIEKEKPHKNRTMHFNNYYERKSSYYEEEYKCNDLKRENYSRSNNKKITSQCNFGKKESDRLYNNWYNQLKTKVRYIEQMIYIEEMSKL